MKVGAIYRGKGICEFILWAPFKKSVAVKLIGQSGKIVPMCKDRRGYWSATVGGLFHGQEYFYIVDENIERPDPASFSQASGVHGPSQIIDHSIYRWGDSEWRGKPLNEMIIYELHIGTFTNEGTFTSALSKLGYLKELGVNAIEIMPVGQFPGTRNWGYDGTYLYAVQNSYGGSEGLKRFVDACHQEGLSVILDVVYNHFGPEGNYLGEYGPYFTDKYTTPWGSAINFDGECSNEVRNFFIENSIYWFKDYHIDCLRLDAVHGIFDMSAKHILRDIKEHVLGLSGSEGKSFYLIAESDLNDVKIISSQERGGYGIDAQWSDDFHHSLHTLLTGEKSGYYEDYGSPEDLVKMMREGFVYTWNYSRHRKRYHGSPVVDQSLTKFAVCIQNHDQVGNRMMGDRLSCIVDYEALKLAAGTLLVSPFIPILFMGEEYAEQQPFLYFVSHSDAALIEGVRNGRKREFISFGWDKAPPDPQGEETFNSSKLNWNRLSDRRHKTMLEVYKSLISIRKQYRAFKGCDRKELKVWCREKDKVVFLNRWTADGNVLCVMNFAGKKAGFINNFLKGRAKKIFDSSLEKWDGPGSSAPEVLMDGQECAISAFGFLVYNVERE